MSKKTAKILFWIFFSLSVIVFFGWIPLQILMTRTIIDITNPNDPTNPLFCIVGILGGSFLFIVAGYFEGTADILRGDITGFY